MSTPRVEPSADMRQWASLLRQMYAALVQEGFKESQALTIIGQTVAAGILGAAQKEEGT